MQQFDQKRQGTGTAEWAEVTENIQIGCANNCLYCYAAHKAATMYGGWCDRSKWPEERLTKRAEIRSYPAVDGVVMFPSTHDITPFNVDAYIRVALLILAQGNRLLIVSKPRLAIIKNLFDHFRPYREQILFRFSIGTLAPGLMAYWEPSATSVAERIDCLELAFGNGFQTSVSIEPILGGMDSAIEGVNRCRGSVSETIWIGKMNKVRLRVPPGHEEAVRAIEYQQRDEQIIELYKMLKDDPVIRWKDSIKVVIEDAETGILDKKKAGEGTATGTAAGLLPVAARWL